MRLRWRGLACLCLCGVLVWFLADADRIRSAAAQALELEITERGGGIETSAFREIVDRFHACGLRLSLDDFGSQYANLALFTNVKFDTVKIDRSLSSVIPTKESPMRCQALLCA